MGKGIFSTKHGALGVALVFGAAVLCRTPFLFTYRDVLNFDEAVYGIMAQDILRGHGVPLFFYGQQYFGPLEALFALPFLLISPASVLFLRLSVMVMTFLSLIFFWQGLRLLLPQNRSWIFLAWTAVSPLVLTVRSLHPSGHIGGLFCGGLLFFLTAQMIHSANRSKALFFFWGFWAGFSLWMHPGTLIYLLAAGGMVLFQGFPRFSRILIALLGSAAGGLPFWLKTLSLRGQTFYFGQPQGEPFPLSLFFQDLGRSLTHMPSFLGTDVLPFPLSLAVWAVLFFLLGYSLFLWMEKPPEDRRGRRTVLTFAWSVIVLTFFAYNYIRAHRFDYISYRYYLPVLVSLGMILQVTLEALKARSRGLTTFLFLTLILINGGTDVLGYLRQAYFRYQFNLQQPFVRWTALLRPLKALGVDRAYTDFFSEGPLNFVFYGRKTFSDFYNSRYPDRSLEVDADPSPAFILPHPGEADLFQQGLRNIGSRGFSIHPAGDYRIFHRIRAPETIFVPLDKKGMQITGRPNPDLVHHLLDDNLATVWSTPGGQTGRECLCLDLLRPQVVCRVDLVPSWLTTFPVRVIIETSEDGRKWTKAADLPTSNTLYWAGPHPAYKVWEGFFQYVFPPREVRYLRIRQTGSSRDPWELAEIVLYTPDQEKKDQATLDWKALIPFLEEHRIERVISDLYFSANIHKKTEGSIRATVRYHPFFSASFPPEGLPAKKMQAVAVHRREEKAILAFLDRQGWTYRRKTFGEYGLIYDLASPLSWRKEVPHPKITFSGSHHPGDTRFLTDKNPNTRWSSLTSRRPGMYLRCDFDRPTPLSGIVIDPGPYLRDLPVSLEILYSLDGKRFQPIPSCFRFFRMIRWTGSHLFGNDPVAVYLFPPLTIRSLKWICREGNPTHYWSIAEISFLAGGLAG